VVEAAKRLNTTGSFAAHNLPKIACRRYARSTHSPDVKEEPTDSLKKIRFSSPYSLCHLTVLKAITSF
jgi:hypothetical protein